LLYMKKLFGIKKFLKKSFKNSKK
jgi:hypothetical protein